MDHGDRLKVYKQARKQQGQFPSISSQIEQVWSIKDLLSNIDFDETASALGDFLLWDMAPNPKQERSQILLAWIANHSTGFDSSKWLLMELVINEWI